VSWSGINPIIFPMTSAGLGYSRFATGEVGDNENNATQTGISPQAEAQFAIAPGNPIPPAFSTSIGNLLGPGGKPNPS
jgi:hypothetical protein